MFIQLIKNNSYKISVIWALIILALCSMPGNLIPSASWLELLSFDKWVHAGIFFVLVSLLGISVEAHGQTKTLFYFYFILSVIYGGALEIMQATLFVARSADWQDMAANTFGCVIALLIHKKINKIILN